MIIVSRDNKLIKYAKKLQDRSFSSSEGKTLVESPKIIKELLDNRCIEVETVFTTNLDDIDVVTEAKIYQISDTVAKYLAQTESTTGVFAIVKIPNKKGICKDKFVVLDNIQDPANYGAIIRSAVAFGYTQILDINCCYAYSNKVTRASMGNNFKVNITKVDIDDIVHLLESGDVDLICCDMNGNDIKNSRPSKAKFGIIIGNEGNGVSKDLRKLATKTVCIPMQNGVESLNASVSAGIIMYNYNK